MKGAARLVSLRGSIAAVEGRTKDALADAERVLTIARHSGEEGHAISRMVAESITTIAMNDLATWASMHREEPAYRMALSEALKTLPQPDLRREHASDLFMLLSVIELLKSERGRTDLGLKQDDTSPYEPYMPFLVNQTAAKSEIVQAARLHWAEIAKPSPDTAVLRVAARKRDQALQAFPTVADLYGIFNSSGGASLRHESWVARRQVYTAALRALEGKAPPKAIKTDDLLSPFDGTPLTYKFDGKKISLAASGWQDGHNAHVVTIPPPKPN